MLRDFLWYKMFPFLHGGDMFRYSLLIGGSFIGQLLKQLLDFMVVLFHLKNSKGF